MAEEKIRTDATLVIAPARFFFKGLSVLAATRLLELHHRLAQYTPGAVAKSHEVNGAFRAGVRQGLKGGAMGADLFAVRARILLGQACADDAPSFTSGLLIGSDVCAGLGEAPGTVTIIGRPELTRLYVAAIAEAGREANEVDGEEAFLAGIIEVARRMS